MNKVTINKGIDAIDALGKIKSLLSAAMYLTRSDKETDLHFELLEVAHETATQVLEADQ